MLEMLKCKGISPVGGNPFFRNTVTDFGYRFAKKSFLVFVFLFFCMIFGNVVTKRITNDRKLSVIIQNITDLFFASGNPLHYQF
jgi:hypothetical protein